MPFPTGTRIFTGHGYAGNWSDPANWDGGKAADQNASAVIPVSATLNGSFTDRILMMLGQETVTVNGALATTSPGLCISFMVCNDAVAVFTPTSSLHDAGGMIVGANETGTLIAQGNATAHATLSTVSSKIGQSAGAHGSVTIAGAVWNDSQNLYVGQNGTGALAVNTNGVVNVGTSFVVGESAGASGTVAISGGGQVNVGTYAKIGGGDSTHAGGSGAVSVAAGSGLAVAGPLKIAANSTLTLGGGTVTVTDASQGLQVWAGGVVSGFGTLSATAGSINNSGTVRASGGTLVLNGAITGGGQVQIADNSTAKITSASIGNGTIAFMGQNAALSLAHGVTCGSTLSGFAAGDSIIMQGVDHITWNGSTDVLTLSNAGQVVDNLHLSGTYGSNPFVLTQSSAGAVIGLATQHAAGATFHI